MLKSHLLSAFRNFVRDPEHSVLNLTSFILGITCFFTILIFTSYQRSFDTYLDDHDEIYRITTHGNSGGSEINWALTYGMVSKILPEIVPQVENATKLMSVQTSETFISGENAFIFSSGTGFFVNSNMFSVLDFPTISGSKEKALTDKYSIILTYSSAMKVFGRHDIVGEKLEWKNRDESIELQVTAVLEDLPQNSHIQFDYLIPGNAWTNSWYNEWESREGFPGQYVYLNTVAHSDPSSLYQTVNNAIQGALGKTFEYRVQPISEIYFNSENRFEHGKSGNIVFTRIMIIVGIFTILVAIINYVILTTSRSLKRSKEFGIRKTIGGTNVKLVTQFLIESVFMSLTAGFISSLLIEYILHFIFPIWFDVSLSLFSDPKFILALTAISIATGLLSGIVPAIQVTRFNIIKILKGNHRSSSKSVMNVQSFLVTTQFIITTTVLISTVVVLKQLSYMENKNLGFDKDLLINVPRPESLEFSYWNKFKEDLKNLPEYVNQGSTQYDFLGDYSTTNIYVNNSKSIDTTALKVLWNSMDPGTIPTLGVKIIKGRNFNEDIASDSLGILINRTAYESLGIESLEDQQVRAFFFRNFSQSGKILGVVEDFQFGGYRKKIEPTVFVPARSVNWERNLLVRINTKDISNSLIKLEHTWKSSGASEPFQFDFIDDMLAKQIEEDKRTSELISLFTIISIIISSLGLAGLISYHVEQRKREVGIRRVFGATVSEILLLFNKRFTLYILISFIISIPIAIKASNIWLDNFADKVSLSVVEFLIGLSCILIISVFVICIRSFNTININPSITLRSD